MPIRNMILISLLAGMVAAGLTWFIWDLIRHLGAVLRKRQAQGATLAQVAAINRPPDSREHVKPGAPQA